MKLIAIVIASAFVLAACSNFTGPVPNCNDSNYPQCVQSN